VVSENGHLNMDCYRDSDWASCLDYGRSTSGYCVFVRRNLASWQSKKQTVMLRSTAEVDYRAMSQELSDKELNFFIKGSLNV
jgi:hypothetical protein